MNGIDRIRQCCSELPFSVTLLNKATVDITKAVFERMQSSDEACHNTGLEGITSAKLQKYLGYYDFARVLPDDEHDRMSCWTKGVTYLNRLFGDEDCTVDEKNCYTVLRAAIEDRYEKYDGRGYPKGKRKNEICVLAQILSMAETAAECIVRCVSTETLIHTLEQLSATQIDPQIVKNGIETVSDIMEEDRQYYNLCDSDEFVQMDYQPVVDCKAEDGSFAVCAYENRMILKDSEYDVLTPEVYVPVAERSGRIVSLTDIHLEKICRTLSLKRYDPSFNVLPVWVGVSPVCLKRKSFVLNLKRLLTKYRIHPDNLVIEVTETALGYEDPQIPQTISALRKLGIKIVLDHFGSEYSSLSELGKTDVDMIRLDPLFAEAVHNNNKTLEIVRSITELAEKLGIDVAVAGVKDESAMKVLSELPISYMQGDLFGIWSAL